MATASTVTIRLDGDSATLVRELNKANRATQSFGSDTRQSLNDAGKAFAAAGAAAAVALGALLAKTFETNDALQDTANAIGIAAGKLAGLQFAAGQFGTSAETITKALTKQQQAIGNAVNGNAELGKTFAQLNLSAAELVRLSPDEQFLKINDAIAGLGNRTLQVAAASSIYGARLTEVLNIARAGSEQVRELVGEAEALGIALSQQDAQLLADVPDALARAQAGVQGLANKLGVALAPTIIAVADEFVELLKTVNVSGDQIFGVFRSAARAVATFADGVVGVRLLFQAVAAAAQVAFGAILQAAPEVFAGITAMVNAALLLVQTLARGASILPGAFGDAAAGAADFIAEIRSGLTGTATDFAEFGDSLEQTGRAAFAALAEEAAKPLPSQQLDAFFDRVQERAKVARETFKLEDFGGQVEPVQIPVQPVIPDLAAATSASVAALQDLAARERQIYEELRLSVLRGDEGLSTQLIALAERTAQARAAAKRAEVEAVAAAEGKAIPPETAAEREAAVLRERLDLYRDFLRQRQTLESTLEQGGQAAEALRLEASLIGARVGLVRDLVAEYGLANRERAAAEAAFRAAALAGEQGLTDELAALAGRLAQARVQAAEQEQAQIAALRGQVPAAVDPVARDQEVANQRLAIEAEFQSKLAALRAAAASQGPGVLGGDFTAINAQLEEAALAQGQALAAAWAQAAEQRRLVEEQIRADVLAGEEALSAQLIQLAYDQAVAEVNARFEAKQAAAGELGEPLTEEDRIALEQERQQAFLARLQQFEAQRTAIEAREGSNRMRLTQIAAQLFGKAWADAHRQTLRNTQTFASAFLGIGQALFADSKALGIANALVSTFVGVTKALELPYPANLAAAAQVLATGIAQVASIRSTNIGGGGGGGGIAGGSVASAGPLASTQPEPFGGRQQQALQVVIQGPIYGWDDYIQTRVVDTLRDLVDNRDVVIFGPGSRQAAEIRGG